jgi:hypothetical protein
MTPFELISACFIVITGILIPLFNYLNYSKQTIIKNDILSTLETKSNKIRDNIGENTANIRAVRAEMKYTFNSVEKRIDKIERYLEKLNGFSPSNSDTNGSRHHED